MAENGESSGVRVTGKTQLVLEYDHVTHQVVIGGHPMPLSLAQMICDEGARVLAAMRRCSSATQLRAALAQQQADEAVAAALRRGR